MKKITNIVMALFCLLMVSTNVQAEVQKRIWTIATNAENLAGFQTILKHKGFDVTATDILAKHFGDAAWEVAKNGQFLDLVDPQYRSRDVYSKEFLRFAFGKNIPARITWAYIQRKGQGKVGWRLPVNNEALRRLQALEHQLVILQLEMDKRDESIVELAGSNEILGQKVSDLELDSVNLIQTYQQLSDKLEDQIKVLQALDGKVSALDKGFEEVKQETQKTRDALNGFVIERNKAINSNAHDIGDIKVAVGKIEDGSLPDKLKTAIVGLMQSELTTLKSNDAKQDGQIRDLKSSTNQMIMYGSIILLIFGIALLVFGLSKPWLTRKLASDVVAIKKELKK